MYRFTVGRAPTAAPSLPGPLAAGVEERPRTPGRQRRDLWLAAAAVGLVALAVSVVTTVAYTQWPPAMKVGRTPQALAPSGFRWLQAWSWWDGAWYVGIAERGYWFLPGRMSPVAFFPAYPLLIRLLTPVTGNAVLAGFVLTLACGMAASILFYGWAVPRVGRRAAGFALAALLLYPCSFYLFGVLYADALLLLLAVGAFVLVERDRPVLAALAAALATATRPNALALVLGLAARTVERRGGVRNLRPGDAGLLLAPLGFLGYCGYLWLRFGDPLLFSEAERAWGQSPGMGTWLKLAWFRRMRIPPYFDPPHYHLVGALLATVVAVALAIAVFRRLGWGYGTYSLVLVVGSAVSTKNFIGMGRYALAAFPIFAAAGAILAERRPATRWAVLTASAALLFLLTELHARNMLISSGDGGRPARDCACCSPAPGAASDGSEPH